MKNQEKEEDLMVQEKRDENLKHREKADENLMSWKKDCNLEEEQDVQ